MSNEKDLKQIAIDLYSGKIFCDRHIRDGDFHILNSIFMPIIFMENAPEDIGMIYEYLKKAGPHAINGYPSFMSMNILTKNDAVKVFDIYHQIKNNIENIQAE